MPVTLIAELGSSPAPTWNLREWIDLAQRAGADAVKVQMFYADHFPAAEQASKRALEFPRGRWEEFVSLAHEQQLLAGASVFDVDAVGRVAKCGDFIKLAAREQENANLLKVIRGKSRDGLKRRCPVYRSVSDLRLLKRGYPFDFGDVILLTIPYYPAPLSTALIKVCYAASYFKHERAWGWSSHTRNILDCWLAAKLGASVLEKHLASRSTDLEAGHSLLVRDFRDMVKRCKG